MSNTRSLTPRKQPIYTSDTEWLRTWRGKSLCLPGKSSNTHHCSLLTASPNPGVSTTVSLSFTPFSSMSTVVASILTVWEMRSAHTHTHTHRQTTRLNQRLRKAAHLSKDLVDSPPAGGDVLLPKKLVRKSDWISVDFPRPDSPATRRRQNAMLKPCSRRAKERETYRLP